jgi:hypothetical protein
MPRKQQPPVNEKPNNEKRNKEDSALGTLTPERMEALFGLAAEADTEEAQSQPSVPTKSKRQIKKDRNAKRSASMKEIWAKRKTDEATTQAPDKLEPAPIPKVESPDSYSRYDKAKAKVLKLLKRTKEVKIEGKEAPGNGHKAKEDALSAIGLPPSPFKYREFIPQELPEKYKHFTPEWLYSGLDWRLQASELKPADASNLKQKLQLGLAVIVLVLFGVVILCMFAIIVGG